jgi:hypothetical protein
MALMLGNLYDALRQAHVPDDVARKAAEEVAGYDAAIAALCREVEVLKWMTGANIGLTLLVLGVLLRLTVR